MRQIMIVGALVLSMVADASSACAQPAVLGKPILSKPVQSGAFVPVGPTIRQKAFTSQLVVSGKVTIENVPVELAMYQGQPVKTTYTLATIRVDSTLIGDKAGETVKVLIPPADPAQIPFEAPGQPRQQYYRPQVGQVQLIDGQEGVFFLIAQPLSPGHFVMNYGQTPLNPLDTNYKSDLAALKRLSEMYADPVKALKAEKAADRFEAASALIYKYRRQVQHPGNKPMDQVAIPAEESKLILKAIQEADWAKYDVPVQPGEPPHDYTLTPTSLVGQLALYPGQNGFPQVRVNPGQGYNAAYHENFKTWMEGEGAKFQIKKFVPKK